MWHTCSQIRSNPISTAAAETLAYKALENTRALTRILKTGVQDSHLSKSRSPTGKSGSPTPKKLESHQFVNTVYLFHFSWKWYICSVYPRNKKGHGNFIKKGHFKRALNDQKGHFMRVLRDQKGHIYCLCSPPPPYTHTKEILIFPVYLLSLLPSQIQHSFLCSFK